MKNQNYEPSLYEVADNWQARWELIREFASKWYGVHFRSRESLLPLVKYEEERLGFKLPPSFQEYIMFHACANHIFPKLHYLRYYPKLSTITFKCLHECDVFDAIDIDDLDKEDPPIQTYILKDEYLLKGRDVEDEEEALSRGKKNTNGYLSSFIFWSIIDTSLYFKYSGGHLSAPIENDSEFIPMMDDIFDRKNIIDGQLVYEKQNIISVVNPIKDNKSSECTYRLNIYLWKALDRKEIPKAIIYYAKNMRETGGHCSGIFSDILDESSKQRNVSNLIINNNDDDWKNILF